MEGQGTDPETLVWQIRGKEKEEVEELWFKIKGREKNNTHTVSFLQNQKRKSKR